MISYNMKKKKTIVLVQNVEYPQQWAIDIFYYSKYLSYYDDFEVVVIVSKIHDDISSDNLRIIELNNKNYIEFVLKAFKAIQKINKDSQVEYVHFFAQHPLSVVLQFFVKYLLGLKTIYDVVSGPIWNGFIAKISYITIRIWIFLSYFYVLDHKKLYELLGLKNKKKFCVIWIWYDEETFFESSSNVIQKENQELIFTYIWTLNKERNLDVFVRAFIDNLKQNHQIRLYFIWYWDGEELLKQAAWEYIDTNIFFLWKRSHNDIPKYINASDILVSYVPKVSYFEYQPPTKLIEYLACNKAVIVTNTYAQEEIMKWKQELLHKDDFESTSEKIWYIVKNFDAIQKNDFSSLAKKYSWKSLTKILVDTMEK